MKRILLPLILLSPGSPAFASSGPFFSLYNTNFVVSLSFLLFFGILFYYRVPTIVGGLLDKRSDAIRDELASANKLREEAQDLLASYERKQREVEEQSQYIITLAKEEAAAAAASAKEKLKESIARRLRAADEHIASAQAKAMREVRDRAIIVAVEAAAQTISKSLSQAQANALIDAAIDEIKDQFH